MKLNEVNGASLPFNDKDAREEFLDKKDGGGKSLCATIDEVGVLSFVSFSWIFHYLWSAYKGRVDSTSQTCAMLDSAGVNLGRMEHLWNEELKRNPTQPSLFRVTIKFMRHRLVIACLIFFFCLVFGFIGPTCLVKGLVSFTEGIAHNDDEAKSVDYVRGFIYTVAILIVELSRVLMYGATWAVSYRTGIRVRGALLALLYKHLMNVKSMRGRTSAEIVNLFANDGQRLFDAVTFAPLVIMGPFVLVGGLIYLLRVIGTLSLLGILVFFVFDILQAVLGVTMVRCRNAAIKSTERRMGLMGEILRCIRVIKMNVWEELFIGRVTEIRREEKRNLRIAGYAQSLAIASSCVVPVVATFVTVLSVVLSGSDLLASDAFSAITVYFVMLFGIRMIPYGMRYLAEARSAIVRMQELLLFEKCDSPASLQPIPISSSTGSNGDAMKSPLAIRMEDASFSWEGPKAAQKAPLKTKEKGKKPVNETSGELLNGEIKEGNGNCLKSLNLKIKKGELIGVCGRVGSGKSAFFHAITGHLCEEGGTMLVNGTVAYVSQVPFVLNATIRDNILFGRTMNSQRYYKAISASQLSKELESMPENEMSMVGERGTTLSGGQKSRVALARAIHSNRDIYLLDDIL